MSIKELFDKWVREKGDGLIDYCDLFTGEGCYHTKSEVEEQFIAFGKIIWFEAIKELLDDLDTIITILKMSASTISKDIVMNNLNVIKAKWVKLNGTDNK